MTAINLNYVHTSAIGYGRYGVSLAAAIEKLGVEVFDDTPAPVARVDFSKPSAHIKAGGDRNKGLAKVAAWVSVPTHANGWWEGQIPVISTMWEATVLPETFRETLHEFDTVIVPSHQNVELFGQYHGNVKLVPLGIDPERWHYVKRTPPGQFFNFLIGGSGSRKGTDLAHKAFRRVFETWPKDGPIPRLLMKNPKGESFYGDRVEMVTGRISDQAEVDLYASAHCYLQPSRGEGFGLQPLQAIAQGCPTILTAAHGHDSFAHLGYGLSTTLSKAAYFIYGDAGEWWEPDFDELCDYMLYVYENWEEAEERGRVNAATAEAEFSWERCAERFLDAIGRDRLELPAPEPVNWYQPKLLKYPTITNRPYTCEIAGSTYQFEPGVEYHEPADVKRILFEAGILDMRCVTEVSEGLLDSQLARVGEYSAAHGYCSSCRQKLGSGVTRSDELFAR